jgi:predicted RNA binding protein YcfA (HicA-like mRNA interferase family)
MKLPRDLSGKNLASALCQRWNYSISGQAGSHIILETEVPAHQRIAIPAHKSLKLGTLGNILRTIAAHKGVSKEEILETIL